MVLNKNYCKGRRKEYYVIEKLRKEGFDIVQRSKGSHSPIDVFAINKALKIIKLIQVKSGLFSERDKRKICKDNDWMNNDFKVEFELCS